MTTTKKHKEAIALGKDGGAVMVDLKFCDLFGQWQHTSVPMHRITEEAFEDGFGFDGSSIRGWRAINESDMLLLPDASTAVMDPFMARPTLSMIANVVDPITRESYDRDPRFIARKVEQYVRSTGLADTVYVGPEAEFFVFDDVRYSTSQNHNFFQVDSKEAHWNSGKEIPGGNGGYTIRSKEGYFPVAPHDSLMDLRTEMVEAMEAAGIEIETSHHEVATAGQCEIDMKFDSLVRMADKTMWFKYIVKNVAKRAGKTATFMPKPLFGDNGSGMHCHQSLWKDGKPLFAGNGYAGMSEMAMFYIGGVLKHAKALNAITNPTTNSYRRLVPGYEAPVNLAYSSRNRSASIRIPMFSPSPKAKRIEVRFPDPSCNPYLAFAALVMAGLDGIEKKIHPGDALDKDIYSLSPEELQNVPQVAGSLGEALDALEKDHEFLLKGDVFSKELIETWVSYKHEKELDPVRLRPVPYEYHLYYDV
ncbi:MAG: type I glutamate--ammonia ligase [Deltaproteobacteria bacterium]|jgi:glutamine synthetase|nr:type I glutamate--ammonia ligase [Myxococcales bacterium]MDP3215681.1 type I glutamate--ammonia ligase [Deltaproteobacteria bacterium]